MILSLYTSRNNRWFCFNIYIFLFLIINNFMCSSISFSQNYQYYILIFRIMSAISLTLKLCFSSYIERKSLLYIFEILVALQIYFNYILLYYWNTNINFCYLNSFLYFPYKNKYCFKLSYCIPDILWINILKRTLSNRDSSRVFYNLHIVKIKANV